MKNINQINIDNKRVLIRVDYNVPINNGKIVDSFRIDASFETIREFFSLLQTGGLMVFSLNDHALEDKRYENEEEDENKINDDLDEIKMDNKNDI